MAIASLAVDVGRVQVARSEMQAAVDAAARAASARLPGDTTSARQTALSMAGAHLVDGAPLVLQTRDVVFGRWNTATQTFDPNSASPNAVRITAYRTAARGDPIPLTFGHVFGYETQDISFTQITMNTSEMMPGIIGLHGITGKNNLFVSSYNSNVSTSPSKSNHLGNGSIGSNGEIGGKNNDYVWGIAVVGPAGSVSGIAVSGGTTYRSTNIPTPTSPAWSPGTNPGNLSKTYSSGGNTTLAGGTYWFTSLRVSGTLTFSGPATVYINGDTDLRGDLRAYAGVPGNLKIYVIGSHEFGDGQSNNNIDIVADIEAPHADMVIKNNFDFRGRMIFRTIEFKNNAELYYDEVLQHTAAGGSIVTVQ